MANLCPWRLRSKFLLRECSIFAWREAVSLLEIVYEVTSVREANLLANLLDAQKTGQQKYLSLFQPQLFLILRETASCLLLEKMTQS
jgi:hypothetical protein